MDGQSVWSDISTEWKSTTPDPYYFDYNGVSVRYDTFSQHILDRAASNLVADATYTNGLKIMYFFFNLFTYRRSLRYGDYFLASRPQPLAVGDVNVPVTGDNVSVIDINKNLHIQRFLNAVNRVGSAVTDYARGIFGYTPKEDDARPRFISSETLFVGSDEIDNTANDQGKVNTNLIAQQSNYMFDVNISDDCVILGLITFEATSAYKNMVERDFYHLTRYDNFIPELQHLGDQKVYGSELSGEPDYKDTTFGYQVRYAEYKFKVNQAHGGFCTNALKQWFFPALDEVGSYIDEDAIRSRPMDFDPYYKSLTGANMADYFHFQISFANNVRGNRAMDYEPTLL